ncbi:MAG: hypothetical protein IKR57_01205 [Bacilli bacterium]|nr:hypothetical protein [Bacilli bacterium]
MVKIDYIEDMYKISEFLDNNILYKICKTTIDNISYFEVDSIKPDKLLINKNVFNQESFFKIFIRFVECRRMLLDQDYKKANYYILESTPGEAEIRFNYNKCNIKLYESITNEDLLVPTDKGFLMELLNLIDNGCDPIIMAKDNQFYLTLGPNLTIKFDRKLLKYIEEFAVNCKHNIESINRLERKNKNENYNGRTN